LKESKEEIVMKTIGILGGLAPESTKTYYDHIIKKYYEKFEDYNYPEIVIYSVNFQKYVDWQNSGNWSAAEDDMVSVIEALYRAGAEIGIIATNTMHKVFFEVEERSPIPLLSIMDATAKRIKQREFKKVGLIGTIFTMQEPFYKDALAKCGIETLVPSPDDQEYINNVIYKELTIGEFKQDARNMFVKIVKELNSQGAGGVILGCTEIPLLINEDDCGIPLFNTSFIHAEEALEFALK
jgi:aspartate racemase